MAPCLLRLCALAALLRPCGAAEPAAPGQPAAGWPGLRRPGAPAAALAGVRRAAQAPTAGGWRPQTALPAAALGVQTLLRDDHADVQDMLLQPVPPSVEAPLSQLQGGLGGRGRLQSLAQRQPVHQSGAPRESNSGLACPGNCQAHDARRRRTAELAGDLSPAGPCMAEWWCGQWVL
ncbi:unnamed protein product [Prorocentrum cordatum]|uniref:Uncharacterized protein n=1 Tax=Prorocentrum cordatum TaxID=2364126 RepID=A0ABN9VDV0_9DINO|nr:unnamed protein product [Polarella glacialis]